MLWVSGLFHASLNFHGAELANATTGSVAAEAYRNGVGCADTGGVTLSDSGRMLENMVLYPVAQRSHLRFTTLVAVSRLVAPFTLVARFPALDEHQGS